MLNRKFPVNLLFLAILLAVVGGAFIIIFSSLNIVKSEYVDQQAEVVEQWQVGPGITEQALARHDQRRQRFSSLYRQVLLGTAAGLAILLLAVFLVMRHFTAPLNKIVASLKSLADSSCKPADLEEVGAIRNNRVTELAEMAGVILRFQYLSDERRRAENELRKLSLAVDQSPSGIMITDTEGDIEYVNQAFVACTGYEKSEVMGQNPRFLQSGSTPLSTYEELWRTISEGRSWRGEFINRRKNGSEYIEGNMIAPIKQDDGSVTNYLAIKEDVSERIKLEVEVLRHRDRLAEMVEEQTASIQAIVDTAADGIITTDQRGEILTFNAAAEKIFGYPADEISGHNISCLMPHPHGSKHDEYMRRYLEGEVTMLVGGRAEVEGRRRDGSTFPLYLAISEMIIAGERRFTVIGRDISAQKEAEAALLASREAAEAANRAKGDFLANMSHEIRTPMNSIIGLSHLCLKTELDDKQRDYLEKVHDSARSLLGIINDILDFSKIEAGKLEIERIPFTPAEVMGQLAAIFAAKIESRELSFKLDIAPDLPPRLLGDPMRLNQILTNLVGNALKFTDEGTIEVRVKVVEDSTNQVLLRFTVRDTGIGMTPEQCARIFGSFDQADTSTSRKYGGTGLGLAISKQLVELMGGEIRVESEPWVGSSFIFTVSMGRVDPATSAAQPDALSGQPAARLSGARLLLAEDDAISRQVARELLAGLGVDLTMVVNGAQVLARLEEAEFDGVLLDLQMPVMDGFTAAGRIRAREKFKDLPVIAMTANAMPSDLEKCRAAGMNDHIGKPIEPEKMLATLCRWITPARPAPLPVRPSPAPAAEDQPDAGQALAEDPVLRELATLPGIKVRQGLRRLNGSVALYCSVLEDFCRQQARAMPELRQALAAGEYQRAERLAHTLKGLAGTIGSSTVEAMVRELEQEIGRGRVADFELLLLPLEQELAVLGRAIEQALAGGRPTTKKEAPEQALPPSDRERLLELIARTRIRLEEFDSGAEETLAGLRALAGKELQAGEALERLTACIGNYDYEQGLVELMTLEKIIEHQDQAGRGKGTNQ